MVMAEHIAYGVTDYRGMFGREPTAEESALQKVFALAAKAIVDAAKSEHITKDIMVSGANGDINYFFGVAVPIGPGSSVDDIRTVSEREVEAVGDYILRHCEAHFVRRSPATEVNRDFERDQLVFKVSMRGHMAKATTERLGADAQVVMPQSVLSDETIFATLKG